MPAVANVPNLREAACVSLQRPSLDGQPLCRKCVDSCPPIALLVSERQVAIDIAACTGCGRCASVCPAGALAMPGFEAPPSSNSASVFECARVSAAERLSGSKTVPCLGGLSAATLRQHALSADVTLVDHGWCARCPSGGAASPWGDAVKLVNGELVTLQHPNRIRIRHEPGVVSPESTGPTAPRSGSGRRAFLRSIAAAASTPAVAVIVTSQSARTPSLIDTEALDQRRRNLEALAGEGRLPAALFPHAATTETLLRPQFAAALCPTGALRLDREDDAERLSFDPALCITCRACEPAGLEIHARGIGIYTGRRTLHEQRTRRCMQCRTRFAPLADETRCGACARDEGLAAEAHGLTRRPRRSGVSDRFEHSVDGIGGEIHHEPE